MVRPNRAGSVPGRSKDHPPSHGEHGSSVREGGSAKTRTGAEWVRHMAESGKARRIALVGATAADARDVMICGESGIMAVCPPWFRPRYEPSKRLISFPNGALCSCFRAEEPNRLRGPSHDAAWCDELAAWERPAAWSNLQFGLRLGSDPKCLVTTTPRPADIYRQLAKNPTTTLVRGSTYENRENLAPPFFAEIVSVYEGTRLGQQELMAELLEISEGAYFARFDSTKHVSAAALYDPRFPVHVGIDAGTSQHTAACWWQCQQVGPFHWRAWIFADYLRKGAYSAENAIAIRNHGNAVCNGRADTVRIDPASTARTGIGPAAFEEYRKVFPQVETSPHHLVRDGCDQIELALDHNLLTIHPSCEATISAFNNYVREQRGGVWLGNPAPNQSPFEDSMDAFRYSYRSRFPEGRVGPSNIMTSHAARIF